MATLFILLPKLVCLPHNTMEFFDFTCDLKMNEYDQLKPSGKPAPFSFLFSIDIPMNILILASTLKDNVT